MSMPPFERDYYHEKTIEAVDQERKLQLALHDKKKK